MTATFSTMEQATEQLQNGRQATQGTPLGGPVSNWRCLSCARLFFCFEVETLLSLLVNLFLKLKMRTKICCLCIAIYKPSSKKVPSGFHIFSRSVSGKCSLLGHFFSLGSGISRCKKRRQEPRSRGAGGRGVPPSPIFLE